MPTPSLVNIPFITAPNVLFSQIPESGAGDFTVTRATTPDAGRSTRVNAAGLIELVPDNIARLDYPLGGGCPALLVEPLAQNTLQRSSEFENAYWGKQDGANVTLNDAISPDGTLNADRINLVSGSLISRVERAGLAYLASTDYTLSFFLKNIALTAGQTFAIRLEGSGDFNLVGTVTLFSNTISVALSGTAVTGFVSGSEKSTVENYGNGWYRYSISLRTGTTAGNATVYLITNVDANRSFHAWGAQLEASSVPTSYILTTTAAVTRSAEQIRRANVSSLIGQTEGTIYLEVEAPTATNDVVAIQRQTLGTSLASGDYIMLQKTPTNLYRFVVAVGGSLSFTITQSAPPTTSFVKIAMAYRGTSSASSAFFINGTQVGSDNTTTFSFPPSIQNIEFVGNQLVGAQTIRIRAFTLYPTRLSNVDLVNITAPAGSFWWGINMPTKLWGTATNEIWG